MRRLARRLAERTARKAAWEAFRITVKRLGVPFWVWPVVWVGRKIIRRRIRKHLKAAERS